MRCGISKGRFWLECPRDSKSKIINESSPVWDRPIFCQRSSGGARVLDQGGKTFLEGRQTSLRLQIGSYPKLFVTLFVKLFNKKGIF